MLYRRLGPQAIQICFDVCSIHQMLLWGQPEPGPGYLSSWGDKNFNTRDKLGQLSHYSHRVTTFTTATFTLLSVAI